LTLTKVVNNYNIRTEPHSFKPKRTKLFGTESKFFFLKKRNWNWTKVKKKLFHTFLMNMIFWKILKRVNWFCCRLAKVFTGQGIFI